MKLINLALMVIAFIFLPATVHANSEKKKIVMVIGAGDSIVVSRAFRELQKNPEITDQYTLEFYTDREITNHTVKGDHIRDVYIVMADFMRRGVDGFLSENLGSGGKKETPRIYSLRASRLAHGLKKKGFKLNTGVEKYFTSPTVENVKNLVFKAMCDDGEKISYDPPFTLPPSGIFHPDTREIFPDVKSYLNWYRKAGKYKKNGFWVGIQTFHVSALKGKGKIEAHIIHTLEKEGINTLPVFGRPPYYESMEKFFLTKDGQPRVQILVGFSFRFFRGFKDETERVLKKINAPVFMPLTAHSITINQWKKSSKGISPGRVTWQVCIPEQSGAVEPTMVGGKSPARLKGMTDVVYDNVPMAESIDFLIRRIKAFHNLQVKPNAEKKIAVLYWNHPPGKQNVGASYLNLFTSVTNILSAMREKGYQIKGDLPTEKDIRERILLSGRNVGSWAPGELEKLISTGGLIRIPLATYDKWFEALDPAFKEAVIRQWGHPEESDIMIKNGHVLIPWVDLGNVILLPQPARGFGENPEQLYHDPKLYPHHQYIAFYFWLQKTFKADAMVSLGKHGTLEWLPGKQIGLSPTCPTEILIQDIPNIYPYIVDNVGEGIQAKRRGRAIIIDHLIPPLKKGGAYVEYRELTAKIDAYHNALHTDAALAGEKRKSVQELIRKLGVDKDLGLKDLNDDAVEEVEHYILELQEKMIPYGLHTFGVSPKGEALDEMTEAICLRSPEIKPEHMKEMLASCGKQEMKSLLNALEGGFTPAGEGNDPLRNPEAIPTGRNFYAFNADKVPSKEAFILGKKTADDMIRDYQETHGKYPQKLGIILWSNELQRNEGVNESAILNLLGITPVWDKKDRVVGLEPIPASILKRPRIDVLIQVSGLYRDGYGHVMKLLDRAVRMAGSQRDVENFIAAHDKAIQETLLKKGYTKDDADQLSRMRVFGPMPGAYSHALQELVPNSGAWEDEKEIADVYVHHYAYAYGRKLWGKPLKSAYKNNLKDVQMTLHSRSSNLYQMLDNDDVFAFLGGLSLAVKHQAGQYPDVRIANLQDGRNVKLDTLSKAIGKDLRTRYLNPKWIEGMKKEGYSGARAMDGFVEHLWGFQVTTPFAVDETQWKQVHEVYIEDKYGLDIKAFFDKNNPWAQQSIAARMLEADRKKYWKTPKEIKKKLAKTYAMNVIEKGVACCEHTCNNPMLQQFVTNFISLNGLLTPKQLDQFKVVIAKATGKTREESDATHEKTRERLKKTIREIQQEESVKAKTEGKKIEGFEMVDEKPEDTKVTASGSEWMVMVIAIGILALLFTGWKRLKV